MPSVKTGTEVQAGDGMRLLPQSFPHFCVGSTQFSTTRKAVGVTHRASLGIFTHKDVQWYYTKINMQRVRLNPRLSVPRMTLVYRFEKSHTLPLKIPPKLN